MPLLFSRLCDLLSALEDLRKRDPPLLPDHLRHRTNETIKAWFVSHRVSIDSQEIDTVALLSTLIPAKRTDRSYHIQSPRLSRCLRRWLNLGNTRWPLLDQWQQPGRGDLSDCVERVLRQAENPLPHNKNRVTLEELDNALETVASRCRFSAPKVRARGIEEDPEVRTALENIYKRLQSRDAKWFTRLILKDFSCLDLPENLILSSTDPRLCVALQMYHDFESAVRELRRLPASQMADVNHGGFIRQCASNTQLLPPRVGTKVGPPKWVKAKGGIKHAVSIIDCRTMSVERKHDGEYCQVHIDLSKGEDCIQIFSKSGKDSTEDRRGIHEAIKAGLLIGLDDCQFSEKCILEGELLVYSDRAQDILGFHKIRKHISRSGSFLGTALDSQPHYWEHLMIIFYDVMLIDNDPVLNQPYTYRRKRLEKLVARIEGRSALVQQEYIDFSKPGGADDLKEGLASALVQRWEGLVLKPADDSYFDLAKCRKSRYPSRWVKLKKDCIKGLGDTADFAVLGAGYDVSKVAKYNIPNLRWTHFYIGCMRNKDDVLHRGAKPHFFVFDEIIDCIRKEDFKTLNELGYIRSMEPNSPEARDLFSIEYASGLSRMRNVFRAPFVFDIAGSGFDKSPNRDIFTLRFPRVMRIHWDRDWKESVSLPELQDMATQAMTLPPQETWSDEVASWVKELDRINKGQKGRLNSWDYSDEEQDDNEHAPTEYLTEAPSRSPRRSRVSAAPTFVRMDTVEMKDRERRLSTGEVVERPTSKHSMNSATTYRLLQTPPPSSRLSKNDNTNSGKSPRSAVDLEQYKTAKRSATKAGLQEIPRPPKKVRPGSLQPTKEPPANTVKTGNMASYKKPLHETTNSANALSPSRAAKTPPPTKNPTPTEFSFVRKLPPGAEEAVYRQHRKRRRVEEPSETSQETTASERSSTVSRYSTSQRIVSRRPASPPSRFSNMATSNIQSLLTPPSTADQAPKIKLPDLRESKIVLSPCLIENGVPREPLKGLLDAQSITPSSFRQALYCPRSNNILHDTPQKTVQIILLVDSAQEKETSKDMRKLLRHVPIWHPMTLAVWDWEVVGLIGGRDPSTDGGDDSLVRSKFYAAMTWDAAWKGQGVVEVRWRDGMVVMVPEEALEGMDS